MKLINALTQKNSRTENGMATHTSSSNACVDLFFQIAAMRGQDKAALYQLFNHAWKQDKLTSLRILFWCRDARQGAGERQIFKDLINYMATSYTDELAANLRYISEYGRWDDLLVLFDTALERQALRIIAKGLAEENGLCAKWMPRKGTDANKIRKYLKLTPKAYRKMLVRLTTVVESAMCAQAWNLIEYEKVPSVAAARYQKAFARHDEKGYQAYLDALSQGETKINASAVYPYDVIKSLKFGKDKAAIAMWQALPDFMAGNERRIVPVVDVSGSMESPAGKNANVTCMDVAVSLGLYICERNKGIFENAFITFSAKPELQYLNGNLKNRYQQLLRSDWMMNTNLQAVFKLILKQAVKHRLKEEDMPEQILILSDMEFDMATSSSWGQKVPDWNATAQDMIEKQYKKAGYKMPDIVYWNIQSRQRNVPVSFDKAGTALVSGFSPSIMKSLLSGKDMTPVAIMNETIHSERYDAIKC